MVRRIPLLRRVLGVSAVAASIAGCQAEFPDGSPFNSPLGRANLDQQVTEDVGAIVHGMQRAEEGRYWSSRLRRGD